ncbi:MAG: phosphorylase [Myxacorys californica WJT36-NPBG1]|nr:phosphorylase [Myxacorys californica WJT36-NPBG1]
MSLLILVPQGAEYQAVCQGLSRCSNPPRVEAIPIGCSSVQRFLHSTDLQISRVVVMGLCGSLSPRYGVGEVVLYRECVDGLGQVKECDRALTQRLQTCLNLTPVRALTSDRIIALASEKQALGKLHSADVVDMEGMAVMSLNAAITMVRVVSDDVHDDVPDLTEAIDPDGKLRSLPLAIGLIRHPIKGFRLIRGSLLGLRSLRRVARQVVECLDDEPGIDRRSRQPS